ncbi:MAG: membrane protein insertase YidC [Nitrospirae bacterium]|nr:MAG: membrane protein insertase YidC [Nitrospirota bacterium]
MERRVVLFLILSLLILFGYDFLLKKLGYTPVTQPPNLDRPQETPPSSERTNETQTPRFTSSLSAPFSEERGSVDQEILEEVETPLYRAVFSNRGAQLRSWQLKQYLTRSPDNPQPIELVYQEGQFPGPLTLQISDPELTDVLQTGLYDVTRDFTVLDPQHPVGHLTFSYIHPERAIRVIKELTFHHDSYVVDIAVTLEGLSGDPELLLGTNFGIVEWVEGFIGLFGPAWMIDGQLEKEVPDPEIHRSGELRWGALQDKYFIGVIIPEHANGFSARKEAERVISASIHFPPVEEQARLAMRLYAGPKQFDILQSFQLGLEDTIDFGWFIYGSWGIVKAVAKPLFFVLRFLYDYTHNYGLAIILLTVGIKLLFAPLQYKSYKAMQGMQHIQPKVAALQEKYKDDRERLNRELIKLYREHKVNPVGGCLPMLLQMPVFVALFNILYMTVDLRQAPFILWITDLSVKDPYYVLPILMGISMVVQQKIMPTTMDPTQAKMMMILPVFLTFIFITFPAGLVLYWLTNNVLTILQQFITDRFLLQRPAPTPISSSNDGKVPPVTDGKEPSPKKTKGVKKETQKPPV